MTNTSAIVIRDYTTIDGGGHAVAHVEYCATLRVTTADRGVFLTDHRFHGHLVSTATAQFRKGFTSHVEVRNCECATAYAARQLIELAYRLASQELLEA